MGKDRPRVCNICGKEERSGWISHNKRVHNGDAIELVIGKSPMEPKHPDWYEKLSKEMQKQYARSKPVPTTTNLDESKRQEEQKEKVFNKLDSFSSIKNGGFVAPQSYMQMKLQKLKQENDLLRASLSASTRSQSANSKFTDDSLGSAASADGLVLRRQHKDEVDALNKMIGELEEKLKRTKVKYKAQFEEQKERMSKLEKKLEAKNCELTQFRSQMSGLEVQCLKIELVEVTVRLEERDKQLVEVKEQLKEWTDTANKLINSKADFDEWKKKFKQMSVPNSIVPSLDQSISYSQDDSDSPQVQADNEDEQMQINTNEEEEYKDSDINTVCHFCGIMVSGPTLKWNGIEVIGALMTHLNNDCSYVDKYNGRVNEAAAQWEKYLDGEKFKPCRDIRSFFSYCNEFFTMIASKIENLPRMKKRMKKEKDGDDTIDEHDNELNQLDEDLVGLKQDLFSKVGQFQDMLSPITITKTFYTCQKTYKPSDSNGYYLIDRELEITSTGRYSMLRRAEEIQSELPWESYESRRWQEELAFRTRYWCPKCETVFTEFSLWQGHKSNCKSDICDVFVALTYDHSFGSSLLLKTTGYLKQRSIGREELKLIKQQIKLMNFQYKFDKAQQKKEIATEKRTPLEQKRVNEELHYKTLFQYSKGDLLRIEDWLQSLARFISHVPFDKVDEAICDAIIIPECPAVFGEGQGRFTKIKSLLASSKVPVAHVGVGLKEGQIFIGLLDSRNHFNAQLVIALKDFIRVVQNQLKDLKKNPEEMLVMQVDYTIDVTGFFMSLSVKDDLKVFESKLKMNRSKTLKQLATCFQFVINTMINEDLNIEGPLKRIKIYNKWVHLLTSGQKKWISMNLHKLLDPTIAFFTDKILNTMDTGLSRIELSNYFYSTDDFEKAFGDISFYEKEINKTLKVLNSMPQVNYRLPFNQCLNSFMQTIDTKQVLIAIEESSYAIAYGFTQRSCRFTGHIVNRTKDTGSLDDIIKRFGRVNVKVFIQGKCFLVKKREPMIMQLPAIPINTKHNFPYISSFKLDMQQYQCYLKKEQLLDIGLHCNDPQFYEIFGGNPVSRVYDNYPMECTNEYVYFEVEAINTNVSQQPPQITQTIPRNRSRSRNQDQKLVITRRDNKQRPYVSCPLCQKEIRIDNLQKHQRGNLCQK